MTRVDAEPRLYRFGQRDRTGWLLGLQGPQCVSLAAGVLLAGLLLNAGLPGWAVLSPLLVAALFAFGRWDGQPLYEKLPVLIGWWASRVIGVHQWDAGLPRLRAGSANPGHSQPDLPPSLAGLSIWPTKRPGGPRNGHHGGAAVIRDDREGTISAVIRVHGGEFSLRERDEQERLLQLWGDALGGFCAERGPVGRVRWIEWAAPAGLQGQRAYLDEHRDPADTDPRVAAYRELLADAAPMSTRHEVLIVVTVEERRVRRRASRGGGASLAEETLLEQVGLLANRLETAGLGVDPPLSAAEIAQTWRDRLDPFGGSPATRRRRRSLVELAGLVSVVNAGPLSVAVAFDHVRVDAAVHAMYVIAGWPRLEVPPGWIEPLLLHAGGVRTVSVHYEPVPPSRSQRAIDKETVKLVSDEEQRTRSGFRIGARHRRAQADVLEREAELVAGYAEFEFTGFVAVTAGDLEQLERSCAEYEQAAAQAGLELRRLDGRHDLALACALPIGRGLAARRFA